jgi:hypothetical protein
VIETYADLQTELIDWMSNSKITAKAETCIQLAEARIRNDILIRRMELPRHGVFNGAVIFLPEDCEAVQRLMYYVGEREVSIPYVSVLSVEHLTSSVGDPIGYTLTDQAIMLYPTPVAARQYTLYYIPFVADLTPTNTTNWLLDRSPNVYLFASCLEAAGYLQDEQLEVKFEARYRQALDALFNASERQRMPSNTPLIARPYRAL